ncbi:hypothetical protein CFELI_03620 [Corynebacterium felinum]|uniref:Uncharacterized protein n=1 Tax=Corynebacterium felinum TaxID=131318 RepID=A0ABU2BAI8_9CORY|nr:hypothetical protein [Corynebacterium felinum]WJY94358.1 hypothetical protein CFELI_03620 [Corynebacterium felinum]
MLLNRYKTPRFAPVCMRGIGSSYNHFFNADLQHEQPFAPRAMVRTSDTGGDRLMVWERLFIIDAVLVASLSLFSILGRSIVVLCVEWGIEGVEPVLNEGILINSQSVKSVPVNDCLRKGRIGQCLSAR